MSYTIIKYGDPIKASQDAIDNGNWELIMRVGAAAKALAPVDFGQLKGSIMWKVVGREDGHEEGPKVQMRPDKDSGIVGTATEYAAYQEFGTKRMKAQPYLRPAVTLEVFGPNGMNVLKKETIDAMAKELSGRGKRRAFK